MIRERRDEMSLQSVDIDWDIHRAIEAERKGFDEPPHIALRRLLGLGEPEETAANTETAKGGVPWRCRGVEIPHGTDARMSYDYGNQLYEGQFLNGKLVVHGKEFDTPSGAADALAVTRDGKKTSLNGWEYWEVRFEGRSDWIPINILRLKTKQSQF